jgi:hypothetical protein
VITVFIPCAMGGFRTTFAKSNGWENGGKQPFRIVRQSTTI